MHRVRDCSGSPVYIQTFKGGRGTCEKTRSESGEGEETKGETREVQMTENTDGEPMCPSCKAGRRLCVKDGFVYRKTLVVHGTMGARVQRYLCTRCGHLFTEQKRLQDGV